MPRVVGTVARAGAALVLFASALALGVARADPGNVARSVDAVAKERADEYEELQKKDAFDSAKKRVEILRGLAFAPCQTARRFLTGIVKKPSAPGDERAEALRSLLHMADDGTIEVILTTLAHDKDPTLWAVFAASVGGARSDEVHAWLKGPALALHEPDALAAVLDAYALHPDPAATERIEALYAKHAKAPGSPALAAAALRALSVAKGAAARPLLLDAARHPDARVRLLAADLVPGLEPFDAEAEAAARALLADAAPEVRQATAVRAGTARRASLAGALIGLLSDPRPRTRHVAATALALATGQSFGHDAKAWAAWYEKRDPGKPEEVTVPTYHGLSVRTDRVVFLVDGSSSMTWPWRKPVHRIDVARAELASVVNRLPPETQFNVAVYAEKVAWFRKAEVAATPENVSAALSWAGKALASPAGETRLFEALEAAFAVDPQFDTVYLLTDGNPTRGRYFLTPNLLASVRAWNRDRRAAIHAIGLSLADEDRGMPNLTEDLHEMSALLSSVASETGGEYREVLRLPTSK